MKKLLILISFIIISTISQARVSYYKAYLFITNSTGTITEQKVNITIQMDNEKNQITIYDKTIKVLNFRPFKDSTGASSVYLHTYGIDNNNKKIEIIINIISTEKIIFSIWYSEYSDHYFMQLLPD